MILYFSGTGNTRWVAQQLAQATHDTAIDIANELRNNTLVYTLEQEENLGFCFPTHGWQPPHIVRDFISRATFHTHSNTYIYAVTTCGDNTGETMAIFNQALSEKGLKAAAVFSVIMPESYVCLPFMYTDTKEHETKKISDARQQLTHIANIIIQRRIGIEELEKGAFPRLYSYVIGSYFNKYMITDKKFLVDETHCIQCGKCAEVCPVDNITGTPPQWLHNGKCTCCLACYHYCPAHAIHYGQITRRRGQYHFKEH